jgi:hypothetical protein
MDHAARNTRSALRIHHARDRHALCQRTTSRLSRDKSDLPPPEKFFRLNPHISALIRTYPHISAPPRRKLCAFPESSALRIPKSAPGSSAAFIRTAPSPRVIDPDANGTPGAIFTAWDTLTPLFRCQTIYYTIISFLGECNRRLPVRKEPAVQCAVPRLET